MFHVRPDGSDQAAGTTSRPWRTLEAALPRLRAGDTLLVHEGVYEERVKRVLLQPGSAESRITVEAAPGESPLIRGLLWLRSPSFWTFRGLRVTWDPATGRHSEHMVKITDGVGWIWEGGELWGAASAAAMLIASTGGSEPRDWTLRRSCIHDTVPTNGRNEDNNLYIGDMQEAGPGLVEDNVIFGAPNGRNIKLGGSDSAPTQGPARITVRQNTLVDAATPLVLSGGTRQVVVERNILARSRSGYLVRGYQLTGTDNVVRDNIGAESDQFFADPESSRLLDGGGNRFPVDPEFDALGRCDALRPTASSARSYGARPG